MLTEDHKLQRVEISQRLLQRCQQDNGDEDTTHISVGPGGDFQANNNLFDNLITGDETWVYLNTPETKRDSMTWKHPSSHVPKKFKVQRSAAKVMATVFWDAKDCYYGLGDPVTCANLEAALRNCGVHGEDCCASMTTSCEALRFTGLANYSINHVLGFQAFCDGLADGGGWTIMQGPFCRGFEPRHRRPDLSEDLKA
ncbi:histone-lysine N-methyltransferase SETMAR [Plakobranchus ocellatus]|uniref:Histone-lysine N-methyltransferase SETMAR n=1 Tax=Plakobranchus ocellatus TaxID=259542 RepID=A0AAV4A012_9GAST|nr:histone-lysine N-methyltransferase SETMAR [Plakobranchus ocellatus]